MCTYIYLNTYKGGYLYVGQRTWDGEGIDPHYKGSSKVAKRFGWKPIKIEILEIVSPERRLIAEDYWITKFADEFGIADCAIVLMPANYTWFKNFKSHGRLINCQTSRVQSAHSLEAKEKWRQTTKRNFSHKRTVQAAAQSNVRARANETRRRSATQYKITNPYGNSRMGANSEINKFVRDLGIETHVDGILSDLRSGKRISPYTCVKGKIKGFKFEIIE